MLFYKKIFVTGVFFTLLSLGINSPGNAVDTTAANLSAADNKDLRRIEAYLNNMKTLRAGFLQVSSKGGVATGKFFMARPGKMRFEYDPPSSILMISDGLFLIYIDKDLEQVSHLWLKNTPIGFLVEEDIKLSGDVTVTKFSKGSSILRATIAKTKDKEQGSITLIFTESPLQLRKWAVIDAQGLETTVTLNNLESAVKIDPALFEYRALFKNSD
jgi:outer membrane lipoprotein-sorting protein